MGQEQILEQIAIGKAQPSSHEAVRDFFGTVRPIAEWVPPATEPVLEESKLEVLERTLTDSMTDLWGKNYALNKRLTEAEKLLTRTREELRAALADLDRRVSLHDASATDVTTHASQRTF